MKLLLYHGADVNHSVRHKLQNHKAFYFAKKAGHLTVEQYLRKCSSKRIDALYHLHVHTHITYNMHAGQASWDPALIFGEGLNKD